jgi:hypothetical protein
MIFFLISVFEQTKLTQGYFYTLSAIAQAFAAIVALNAVFVVYKLQLLKNQRNELIKELRRLLEQQNRWSVTQIEMWTNQQVLDRSGGIPGSKKTSKALDQNESVSDNITKWLKITLVFNVTTIMFSLILLPWGGLISDFFKDIVLIGILILALFSLLITVNAILITLESGELKLISKIFESKK